MNKEKNITLVDNSESHLGYFYENKFNKLFNYNVQKELLRWCIYYTSINGRNNDLARVYEVCINGIEIFDHYKEIYDLIENQKIIVILGCLMHDLGYKYNKKDHHLVGYGLVYEYLNRYCPNLYTAKEINEIAVCVLEHHGYNKKKPSTFLSEIVNVAIFGQPDMDLYINNFINFQLTLKENNFISKNNIVEGVCSHILNKFGSDGYFWDTYPSIGKQYYNDEWGVFKSLLSNDKLINKINEKISTL